MSGTLKMKSDSERAQALMAEITQLAPKVPDHKLAAWLVDGSKPLTLAQAQMVLARLRTLTPVAEAPAAATPAVSRETSAPAPARQVPPPMAAFDLPAGYYATPSRTGHNDLDFWRIDRPTGKWAGRIFAKRVVGGGSGDEMQTFQLDPMQQRLACQAITETGTDVAQALFADNLDRCVDCGRALTDDVSRAAKRGPVCRNKPRR
jgi:Family of unknown function (DUF6011)